MTHKGGEFVNNGTVAGRELVQFDSESIRNTGKITGGAIVGNLSGDVENIGGTIEADRAILLNVAGNFTHRSTTHTTEVREVDYERTDTTIARKGLLHVKGKDGTLHINANNIDISGADVINDGQGSTYLSAKNQLNLTALQVGFDEKMGGGNHYRNESVNDVVISRIKGNGDVTLSAKDIYSQGADFDAKARLALMAENDIVLGSATRQTAYEEYHKTQSGNALAKKTKTTYDYISKTDHKGTELTAESILMKAGHDIQGESLLAVSRSGDIDIIGGNNVTLSSATNQLSEQHNLYEKYKNEPRMLVAIAEKEGNINFLEEIFFKKKEISIFYVTPKENWNWLHQCNLNNYSSAPLSVVEFYIKNGVDINMQDMYGMTPLHYAMRAKNIDAAMALLNAGANPNVENQDKVIPLSMIGGIPQALDVIELMLKKGGNVHYFNGQFELIDGMKRYNGNKPEFKAVIELLEKYS